MLKKVLRLLDVHDAIYDREYYDRDVEGPASQAAPHIAEGIIERFSPKTLVDVGCGTGVMLAELEKRNVKVSGLEYSTAGIEMSRARGLEVVKFDIERDSFAFGKIFDVALSMEVAEHLPASTAHRYVRLLCSLAPIVILSAARPGQTGTDHVNLQPRSYWIEKFKKCDFSSDVESMTWLASRWEKASVAGFYHENLMVFRRQ